MLELSKMMEKVSIYIIIVYVTLLKYNIAGLVVMISNHFIIGAIN